MHPADVWGNLPIPTGTFQEVLHVQSSLRLLGRERIKCRLVSGCLGTPLVGIFNRLGRVSHLENNRH